jgi:NADH:ubiquinone oxidoreductase subunit C
MTPELQAAIGQLLGREDVAAFGMVVPAAQHFALAKLLKDNGYLFYVTVVASHWPAQAAAKGAPETAEHFEVATVLRNLPDLPGNRTGSQTFSWCVDLAAGQDIDSLVPLFAGADWQEREQYDLVGVRFAGHPDLRRLMMDEDWPGHPLRRDYAIETPHAPWR